MTPGHEWWINIAEIPNKHEDRKVNIASNFTAKVTLENYNATFYEEHKRDIVLDMGCSVDAIFCNPDDILDIRKAEQPLYMATSTGVTRVTEKATIPGIGEVWYDASQPTKLLSFGCMADQFKLDYKPETSTFDLHLDEGMITFIQKEHICVYHPSKTFVKYIATKNNKKNTTKPSATKAATSTKARATTTCKTFTPPQQE